MTDSPDPRPVDQLAAIRSRLEHPRRTVLPDWKPAPLMPPHHLVMLHDLDLQPALFMYFDRIDPYLQIRFGVELVRMGVQRLRRLMTQGLLSLVELAADSTEQLAVLVDSSTVRELVRSAVQIHSHCDEYRHVFQQGDESLEQAIRRELEPGNWQRRLLQSPYAYALHHTEAATSSLCLPPEPVLQAHMERALVVEAELAPLRNALILDLAPGILQLIYASTRTPVRRVNPPTPFGAFTQAFAHTMHALRELVAAIPLAGGYRLHYGPWNEEIIEPSMGSFSLGSKLHTVLDEIALALDTTTGDTQVVSNAIGAVKATLFVEWMRRTPLLVEPSKGQTTAGRETPQRVKPSAADVVPLEIEVRTTELTGGRIGEQLTAYATDDDGRRRKAGWLSLEQSTHVPGAWQVADGHVMPDWQMRGVATGMLLYALDIHETLHPDWVGQIPQWVLHAWRRLLMALTPSGARVRVCYPRRVKAEKAPSIPDQLDVVYLRATRGSWPEGCQPEKEPRATVRADVPKELREFALAIAKREELDAVSGPATPAVPLWPTSPHTPAGDVETYQQLQRYLQQPPTETYDPLLDRPAPRNEPEMDDQPTRAETGRPDFLSRWLRTTGATDDAIVISEVARWYARWLREQAPRIAFTFRLPLADAFNEMPGVDARRLFEDAQRPSNDPEASAYLQTLLDHAVDRLEQYADRQLPAEEWSQGGELFNASNLLMAARGVARDDVMPWTAPIRFAIEGLQQAATARASREGAHTGLAPTADQLVQGFDVWLAELTGPDFVEGELLREAFVRAVRRRMSVFSADAGFD